nr:hypothetical protein [Caldilineaceae bacterium]
FAHGEAGEVQYGGSVALEGAPNHLALADLDGDGQLDAAVVLGIVMATRGQRTRFAWPQGRYQKYRSYRRI